MLRTQIQLKEEQMKSLKKLAEKKQVSIAELIRQGVNVILKTSTAVDEQTRRARAIAAAGRFHSGKHDLSARHDEYVVEAYRQ